MKKEYTKNQSQNLSDKKIIIFQTFPEKPKKFNRLVVQ